MKIILHLFVIFFCSFNILATEEIDYYINFGLDFSTGRHVYSKVFDKNGKKEVAWTRICPDMTYAQLYKKYGLGHDKPLIHYVSGTGYSKNYFIQLRTRNNGWDFWRWNWYFFTDIPSVCWDGYSPVFTLLNFMSQNDLPLDTAQKIYRGCVERFDDRTVLEKYVNECMDDYEKEALLQDIVQIIATGDRRLYLKITPERVARLIEKYRASFPEQLSEQFLALAAESDLAGQAHSFLLREYLRYPTKKNAAFLLSAHVAPLSDQENCLDLSWLFQTLHKNNMLQKFIAQLDWPEQKNMPLPEPVPRPKNGAYLSNRYYTDTYGELPEREKLLRISCYPQSFKVVKTPSDPLPQNPADFIEEIQFGDASVTFKLKKDGIRFFVMSQNRTRATQDGESFQLKTGESMTLRDGCHLNLLLTFLPQKQLNKELQWLCDKAGYKTTNVLHIMESFNSKSFGREQLVIRDILILPYSEHLETCAFRILFLNCYTNRAGKYVVLSERRPESLMHAVAMNTNHYEDVLLRLKDALKKGLADSSPFSPSTKSNPYDLVPVFILSDRPDERVFMQHFFEVKDVFSIEVTPTTDVRSNIEIRIDGVDDRPMFIYTKFNPAVTAEFKQKIKKNLTPENLLLPQK